MVNGPYIIFVEQKGRLIESGHKFLDDDHVERIIKRIVKPLGRAADAEHPRQETDPAAEQDDDQRVDRQIGDGKVKIHGPRMTFTAQEMRRVRRP